jgi:hypothetical protein
MTFAPAPVGFLAAFCSRIIAVDAGSMVRDIEKPA